MNYALVVKASDQNWEVIGKYNIRQEAKLELLSNAIQNQIPITGMVTTQYGDSVVPFAIWDGGSFSGGFVPEGSQDWDWSLMTTYSVLVGNTVALILYNVKNDQNDDRLKAAFQSEVTLVPINVDNIPKIGWIWNGEQFLESN